MTTQDNTIPLACGQTISLRSPAHSLISIDTIAHSLAQINRFTGHAARPYSVAEHSLLVAEIIERAGFGSLAALAGLMHDAHEALVGDVTSPVKQEMRRHATAMAFESRQLPQARAYSDFDRVEAAAQAAVRARFGLIVISRHFEHIVGAADMQALATERRDLMPAHPEPWPCLEGVQPVSIHECDLLDSARCCTSWADWRDAFIARFHELDALRCEAERGDGMALRFELAAASKAAAA